MWALNAAHAPSTRSLRRFFQTALSGAKWLAVVSGTTEAQGT